MIHYILLIILKILNGTSWHNLCLRVISDSVLLGCIWHWNLIWYIGWTLWEFTVLWKNLLGAYAWADENWTALECQRNLTLYVWFRYSSRIYWWTVTRWNFAHSIDLGIELKIWRILFRDCLLSQVVCRSRFHFFCKAAHVKENIIAGVSSRAWAKNQFLVPTQSRFAQLHQLLFGIPLCILIGF